MYSLRGLGDANSDYVTSLFLKYAGRAPNATEMSTWTTHLANNDFTKPVIEAYFASVFGVPGTSSSAVNAGATRPTKLTWETRAGKRCTSIGSGLSTRQASTWWSK
jgi:hypothetical protein